MSAITDVRAFAALCARLDDPFADAREVLRAAGLDEGRWGGVREQWLSRMEEDAGGGESLAGQFAEAYADELRKRRAEPAARDAAAQPETTTPEGARPAAEQSPPHVLPGSESATVEPRPVEVPSFLKERPAPPPAPEPPAAPLPLAAQPFTTETTEINIAQLFGGKLPFDPSKPSAAAIPRVAPQPKAPLAGETAEVDVAAIRDALAFGAQSKAAPGKSPLAGETAEVDIAAIARQVLPLGAGAKAASVPLAPTVDLAGPPPVEAGAPPGKRLIRFDPRTGQPLAVPYWEDVPGTGGKR